MVIERTATKALASLPRMDQGRILAKLDELTADPRQGAIKLTGATGWRVRQGNFRIVYVIDDTDMVVTVTRIGHRRDVYRRM